ncbi:MAG: DUF4258 domain-containing protein [Burkholderiales bacterium]
MHALGRLLERGISRDDVLSVIGDGEIIESYPSSKPLPSYLILWRDETAASACGYWMGRGR